MRKLSVEAGNLFLIIGLGVGIYILTLIDGKNLPFTNLSLLTSSFFLFLYCSHCLSHYIVGKIIGVRFSHYRIDVSQAAKADVPILGDVFSMFPVFLGLRTVEDSKGSIMDGKLAVFYSSGALATMLSPIPVILISVFRAETLSTVFLLVLESLTVFINLTSGREIGDFSRARKALSGEGS